jgi:hypothetical protein
MWRIILKWISKMQDLRVWIVLIGSGQGPVVGSFELSNKSSGSIKCWEFVLYLSHCLVLKKD